MIPEPQNIEEINREAGLVLPEPANQRVRHAVRLLARYWTSGDWMVAWSILLALVALNFGGVYFAVWMNRWQQHFYDSIQFRAAGLFGALVTSFLIVVTLQLAMSTISSSLLQWLGIRWRTYLTERYLGRWFARDRFYEIERLRLIDNPDQRIAEDLAALTGGSLGGVSVLVNAMGLFQSLTSAIAFSVVLFATSQPIHLAAFGRSLNVPGDMVWYGWVYALAGAAFIVWIGRPYVRRTMRQQHYEANFRAGLLHVRRDAAQIAFAQAQPTERRSLDQGFAQLRRNFYRLILANVGLNVGQGVYERVGTMIPLFLTVPRYFGGAISFGQVMAAKDAFEQLTGSLSYFVQAYGQIGGQVANVNRLKALDDALDHERPRGIGFQSGGTAADVALRVEGMELRRPHGAPLLTLPEWTVRYGERWMIAGPSGVGKSTLLRAVAGLWPDGLGSVAMSDRGLAMFVPQRLYLPLGTLKDAVCFPHTAERHSDAEIVALLDRVRLSAHAGNIHALRMWQDELSPGEQQRLALARILLHGPDLLVLDEATSALDPDNARYFYETLAAALPDLTLLSVVHDEHLLRFHNRLLRIEHGHAIASHVESSAA